MDNSKYKKNIIFLGGIILFVSIFVIMQLQKRQRGNNTSIDNQQEISTERDTLEREELERYRKDTMTNIFQNLGDVIDVTTAEVTKDDVSMKVQLRIRAKEDVYAVFYQDELGNTAPQQWTPGGPDYLVYQDELYILRQTDSLPVFKDLVIFYEAPYHWTLMLIRKGEEKIVEVVIPLLEKEKIAYLQNFHALKTVNTQGKKAKIVFQYALKEKVVVDDSIKILNEGQEEYMQTTGWLGTVSQYKVIEVMVE